MLEYTLLRSYDDNLLTNIIKLSMAKGMIIRGINKDKHHEKDNDDDNKAITGLYNDSTGTKTITR